MGELPSSSNHSNGTKNSHHRKSRENKANPVPGRKKRAGFSDSFSFHDFLSLGVEAEEGEVQKAGKDKTGTSSVRGVQEDCSNSSELETTTSSCLESEAGYPTEGQLTPTSSAHWQNFVKVLKKGTMVPMHAFPSIKKSVPKLARWKSKRIREGMVPSMSSLDGEFCFATPSWKNFSLAELAAATNGFSRDNLIGEGGYAQVYKGQLEDGRHVAIKKLNRGSAEEMTVDYLSEIGIMVHVDHPNIAKLIGYGVEGGMHLVLQLSPNGSLASLLYGPKEKLDWNTRYKIALGTAEGLLYLHEGCQRRIIHKDIKASNILLTEDFEAQISDFGLAKWLPEHWTHHTVSKIEGTFGYLPPEFFMHGIVDEKTDVYAYGVLLLELITGRQALDSSQKSIVMWAKPKLRKDSIPELVDPVLSSSYDLKRMERLVFTASLCIDQSPMQRPQMRQVVEILHGDESSLQEIRQQQKSKLQRTYSEELLDADDYNSTKYLNDMNRHMEVMLGQCNGGSYEL